MGSAVGAKREPTSCTAEKQNSGILHPGCKVYIWGIKNTPELNGQGGALLHIIQETSRWSVRCDDGQKRSFKAENLAPEKFYSGRKVIMLGLQSAAELNGRSGILEQIIDKTGRWEVKCEDGQTRSLKSANLAPAEPYDDLGDVESLLRYVRCTGVKLLRGRYLWHRHIQKQPLQRHQDIQHEYFVCPVELNARVVRGDDILVISHPWWSISHPDPAAVKLGQIWKWAWERYQGDAWELPIFFDFCCLPQMILAHDPGPSGKPIVLEARTPAENVVFRSALGNMHVLYAHDYTQVLRVDTPIPSTAQNSRAYDKRGWCVFEYSVSSMKSTTSKSVSFSDGELDVVPVPPEDFSEELKQLKFTTKADSNVVAGLYEKVFRVRTACTKVLQLSCASRSKMVLFSRALHAYSALACLKLDRCDMESEAADALAAALKEGAAPSLREVVTVIMRLQDNLTIFAALGERGIRLEDDKSSRLLIAARNGCTMISQELIDARADVEQANKSGVTPTIIAAEGGHSQILECLVSARVDVNKAMHDGSSAAMAAARNGHTDALRVLVSVNVDVDQVMQDGRTAAIIAAQYGQLKALEDLISAQADVNKAMCDGRTAMIFAAGNGDSAAVERLISVGAAVDTAMFDGSTAAMAAACYDHPCVLQLLVDAKMEVDKASQSGSTAALIAAQNGNSEALQVLILAKADVDKAQNDEATAVILAAQSGHSGALKLLISAKADVDKVSRHSGAPSTAAIAAAMSGHLDSLSILISARADLDKTTQDGTTPAIIAAQRGYSDVLQTLISARADMEKARQDGATALHASAFNGHSTALQVLVSAKADIHKVAPDGSTAALLAAHNGHSSALQVLISAKADVALAAVAAAQNGHCEVLQCLIAANVDVNQAMQDGCTATMVAAQHGYSNALRLLVSANADVDQTMQDGRTAAIAAAFNGHSHALQVLISAKADVDRAAKPGGAARRATAAIAAAQNGHFTSLQLLISAKADVDKAMTDGATAAFVAAQNGHCEALRLLISARADMNKATQSGQRPVETAASHGHWDMLHLLG